MADRNSLVTIWRNYLLRSSPNGTVSAEQPFRDELLSADQLDRHARQMAAMHTLARGKSIEQLVKASMA